MVNTTGFNAFEHPDFLVPYPVRFWLLLISFILSVSCSIFILYQVLSDRTARQALHNHIVIVLLIANLLYQIIDIPFLISFYRTGSVPLATPNFCLFWIFGDETFFSMSLVLVAAATIQRHILIFNSQWLTNGKKRFLIHYLPMLIITTYNLLFHVCTILFPPCQNTFSYDRSMCGRPLCLYHSEFLPMWDIVINELVPTLLIVIFSIALLVRVIRQKRRALQQVQWRKHRKMTIQILSISFLYFFLYVSLMCIEMVQFRCTATHVGVTYEVITEFLSYYVMFLFPFVNLLSLPNVGRKIKRFLMFFVKGNKIEPSPGIK